MLKNISSLLLKDLLNQQTGIFFIDNIHLYFLKVHQSHVMSFVGMMRNAKQWVEHATSATGTPLDAQTVCSQIFYHIIYMK